MATVQQRLITAAEFAEMPDPDDGSKQELLRGEIITMPPPQGPHGIVCGMLTMLVGSFIHAKKLGWFTCNDAGFISETDPDSVRGPDFAFWKSERQKERPTGYFQIPPDLAVEVISPSDTASRVSEKVEHYLKAGVSLVWLVDPELRIVTVAKQDGSSRPLDENDTLTGNDVLPGFSCKVGELFG